jgi:Cys-tRNA(Pro)/Cys-tRNA(Cys) deacylase
MPSPARLAADQAGLRYRVIRHGPAGSLAEALLKVSRLALPDPAVASAATGYERGTISPFGSREHWRVSADKRIAGREITLGAGQPGVAIAAADAIIEVLGARLADVSQPDSSADMPA